MRKRVLAIAAVCSMVLAPALCAQRGAGRGGAGAQRQRPTTLGQPRGAPQGPAGEQAEARQRQRTQVRATDQQRGHYRNTLQAAHRVRTRAREMARAAKGRGFNSEEFRQLHVQLLNEIQAMQEEHERLMQELSEEQRTVAQEPRGEVEVDLKALEELFEAMDEELGQADPDPKRVAGQAKEIERAAKDWEKDYVEMGWRLGLED